LTDRPDIIVCTPIADQDSPVTGASKEFCELCATPIWLAPTSFAFREQGSKLQCTACALSVIKTLPNVDWMPPTEEQRIELGTGKTRRFRCILCGKIEAGFGNNPEPLVEYEVGRCCGDCNQTKVIPARLRAMRHG
jgi:hypothetical protein